MWNFFFCIWISKYCVSPRPAPPLLVQVWLIGQDAADVEVGRDELGGVWTPVSGLPAALHQHHRQHRHQGWPATSDPWAEGACREPAWALTRLFLSLSRTVQGRCLRGVCGLGAEPLQCINQVINSSPPLNTVTVLRTSLHVLVCPRGRDSHHCCLKHKSALLSLSRMDFYWLNFLGSEHQRRGPEDHG